MESPEKLAVGDGRLQQEGGGAGRLVRERRCVRGRDNPSGLGEEMRSWGNRWVGLRKFWWVGLVQAEQRTAGHVFAREHG